MHIGTACVLKAYIFQFFLDFGAALGANMAGSAARPAGAGLAGAGSAGAGSASAGIIF